MSAPTPHDSQVLNPDRSAALPPEEKFWQRYSPHHEFPLSSVASVCLYGLGALLIWAVVVFAMKQNEDLASLPVEPIVIAGGGGNPQGEGKIGSGDRPLVQKDVARDVKPEATPLPAAAKEDKLPEVNPDPVTLPEFKDLQARIIEDSDSAGAALSKVSVDARTKLFQGLGPVSKGQGGPGEGGGLGKGKGPGEGDLEGPGKGTLNVRQKRILRWVMMFNTRDGNDYLTQLRELGAILAIPDPNGPGYLVIRDLGRLPVRWEHEDLASIKRIFWIDDKPQSVGSLAQALRLPMRPPHVVAFFPESLEKKLLEKELKYGGKREEDIKETRFRVVRHRGTYEPEVDHQN